MSMAIISVAFSVCVISVPLILYIIAEAKRKWIPTIKEVLTNRIIAYLRFK